MSEKTGIQWTEHTFNPWWGCVRISDGCKHCYAADFSKRYGFDLWRPNGERRFFGDKHWNEPRKWNRTAEAEGRRARVFCASMADVFEDHPALDEPRDRLFRLIEETPFLDWQILTKRAAQMRDFFLKPGGMGWPSSGPSAALPNLWLGVSCEDQRAADERIPPLLQTPGSVRFVSAEPLLGDIQFDVLRTGDFDSLDALRGLRSYAGRGGAGGHESQQFERGLDWVIVGGESGPGARPCDLAWIRSIKDQCKAAGVACFVKQLGAEAGIREPDRDPSNLYTRNCGFWPPTPYGEESGWILRMKDRKGGDPSEWPEDLRVREFPR